MAAQLCRAVAPSLVPITPRQSSPGNMAPGAQIPPAQAADPVSHCVPDVAACPRRECGSSLPTSASLTTWCGCYIWQKAESHCWVPCNLTRFAFREDGLRRCLYWTDVCVYIYIYFSNIYIYFFFPRKISNESRLFCILYLFPILGV